MRTAPRSQVHAGMGRGGNASPVLRGAGLPIGEAGRDPVLHVPASGGGPDRPARPVSPQMSNAASGLGQSIR
jgi:hypothetical protein